MATASSNRRWFASVIAGTTVLGSSAFAVNNVWQGDVVGSETDWNAALNWSLNRVPANPNGAPPGDTFDDAYINLVTPHPVLTVNAVANPRDLQIGVGAATAGQLDIAGVLGGTLTCSGGCRVGDDGGTGTLNVANTAGSGGTLTGMGLGGGSLSVGGQLYVGGDGTGIAGGTANFNTTGTISMGGHFIVGNGNGPGGTVNLDGGNVTVGNESWIGQGITGGPTGTRGKGVLKMGGGTLTSNNWVAIGREGGDGTVTMTGGTWNKTGSNHFIVADRGLGKLELPTGGNATINVNNEMWVGQGTSGTFGNGNGTLELHSGAITVGSWLAIGREGGTGTVNMTGGTWTKNGSGTAFIVGSSGLGTMTMSGGTVTVAGITWVSELGGANGSALTLSGTADFTTPVMSVAPQGDGTLHLNGGTLRTGRITGKRVFGGQGGPDAQGGIGVIHFNGTQIIATASDAAFIADVNTLNLASSTGLRLNTNNFDVTATSALTGTGGIVKSGAGTFTLTGANGYSGPTALEAGTLNTTTASTGDGSFAIEAGTTLGVTQASPTGTLNMTDLTFNGPGGSTLNLTVADAAGNPANALIDVGGALTLNAPITVNLSDVNPAAGTLPLISHASPTSGSGSFVVGTVPNGVTLNPTNPLTDSGGIVALNIDRVNAAYWVGDGLNAEWTTANNFKDDFSEAYTTFVNGDPALFDDRATILDVTLNTTVQPGFDGVTFDNVSQYTLSGSGAIAGSKGLVKLGSGAVVISTNNTYTGITRIGGGTLSVATLTDAGVASPIGAASAAPANIVLSGGTLEYTGTSNVSIDRGFTITGSGGGIATVTNSVEFEGQVASTGGNLIKSGAGNLTLSFNGANVIGGAGQESQVQQGDLILTGGGAQTVSIPGALFVATVPDLAADLTLTNTAVTIGGFLAIGRGNGDNGVCQLTATNSTLQIGALSAGYNNGLTANASEQIVTLNNSTITTSGPSYLGESNQSTTTMTLNGTSEYNITGNILLLGRSGSNPDGTIILNDSSKLVKNGAGHLSIGNEGKGKVVVNDNAEFTFNGGDFNISDVGTSTGTLVINDNATANATGVVFVGKNGGTTGNLTVNGGTFNSSSYITVGRHGGATGVFTMNGGVVNQTEEGAGINIGENGTGTLHMNGGQLNVNGGGLYITAENTATGGNGTLNLNGGVISAKRVVERDGNALDISTMNFNGGLLVARSGANPVFMNNLDNAFVKSGGANIDTNSQNIAIAQALLTDPVSTGGGLTKSGAGTLLLNGANTYTGTTNVSAGTLGGTGTIAGPIDVSSGATLAPGASTGTLTAQNNVTFEAGSIFSVEVDAAQTPDNDVLAIGGNLHITAGATLAVNLTGTPPALPITIATFTSRSGTEFTAPPGVTLAYNATNIQITAISGGDPFNAWIAGFSVGGETAKTDDFDKDGLTNLEEFGLDGNPATGAATGKIRSRIETVAGEQALVITFPVRDGVTSFDNNPGPGADGTSVPDDLLYTVRGSNTLSLFDQGVTEVTPPSTGNPAMPALNPGWSYRTFRLTGAIPARGAKGFLAVDVEDAP